MNATTQSTTATACAAASTSFTTTMNLNLKPWSAANVAAALRDPANGIRFTTGRRDGMPLVHIEGYRRTPRPIASPYARRALVHHLVTRAGLAPPPAGMQEPLDVLREAV